MVERLQTAYKSVAADLMAASHSSGYWPGRLSSSPLATATAVSGLVCCELEMQRKNCLQKEWSEKIQLLIFSGLHYLAKHQNEDGGWGDTDRSHSNIATTLLVRSAFQMAGAPAHPEDMLPRADAYIAREGNIRGLRKRYGKDKTFAAPILANMAIAGLTEWKNVPSLPFEWACLPQSTYRFLRLPVVSYAIPALVAVGLARFRNATPYNPISRYVRKKCITKGLRLVREMQPESGGFLEAIPLTSFVAMCLSSAGHADHPVVASAIEFIANSVRDDGSWPIDTNLSVWNTSLSVSALSDEEELPAASIRDWLLARQQTQEHRYTAASPGGWSWTERSGGVPDVDDTSGALLALRKLIERQQTDPRGEESTPPVWKAPLDDDTREHVHLAAHLGTGWLLDVQNDNGGWPTFCRGWGKLPFDRSGTDLTAHAIRALSRWSDLERSATPEASSAEPTVNSRVEDAIARGFEFLEAAQHEDGRWLPLWFGNQAQADQSNPIYGTARVLMAYRDTDRLQSPAARRGWDWLLSAQDLGGGWGGSGRHIAKGQPHEPSSIEETSLALEALLSDPKLKSDASVQHMIRKGLAWLTDSIERGSHEEASPIGLYFAKLWYYERLYPLIFATSALARAIQVFSTEPQIQSAESSGRVLEKTGR
ncbi:MAG: prenyltransferase/squalene oxidase repeat-containing protein [Pirellulales bacterium]|nr:prenyltransferase/squalene oxidase repeat-containing protein [Pirellulales bacterium]